MLVERMPGNHREVWQVWHSILSFAAGGALGKGPGQGTHKYGFVAEQETDFIFSLVGEELGWWGTSTVVLLYVSLVLSGLSIAWNVADAFGQLLVLGITFMIGLQALINLGVVTSLLPNKDLPLPFVSYGGSNLMALLAGVGCVVSVARYAPCAAALAAPLLERINGRCPPAPSPPTVTSKRPLGWCKSRLMRFRYGPHWFYWISLRHPYQLPPKPLPYKAPDLN